MKRLARKTALHFTLTLLLLMVLLISALADDGAGGNEYTQTVNQPIIQVGGI